jgi:hypothetical protein
MSAKALAVGALFSHLQLGRDLHFDGEVVWAASAGGVEVFDSDGRSVARLDDLPSRDSTAVGWFNGALTVGTAGGAYAWDGTGWRADGPRTPVVSVTELGVVYRDGRAWPSALDGVRTVEAVAFQGEIIRFTADGRMLTGTEVVELPGPVADAEVVDGELRIALHMAAAIWDGDSLSVLPLPATAAGRYWGTADGALLDDSGERVGGVPAFIEEVREVEGALVVNTDRGVWSVGVGTKRWTNASICDNFITGIARHQGELVVSTFNGGACAFNGETWRNLPLPSTMANDVLSDGERLWVATAEGLVDVGGEVYRQVSGRMRSGQPGTNHDGINALALGPDGVWAADVLGPVDVSSWRRHRWAVNGHSHQAIAACEGGEVWVGSEDAGLSVRGVSIGSRNGRSQWRQFGRLDGLPEDWVMAVACAGDGAAWVGTYRNGVGMVDSNGWTPVLPDQWVQFLLVDEDVLWIGTADGLYRRDSSGIELIVEEDVHALFREEGALWVGTRSGLLRLAV